MDRHAMAAEYQHSLAIVRGCCRKRAAGRTVDDRRDAPILAAMAADLEWTIGYMLTGDDRAVHADRRPVPIDPAELGEWIEGMQMASPIRNTDEARADVLLALDVLSEREREAFLLVRGDGFSLGKAAELLGVGKSTVQSYLERAREKIAACRDV